MKVIETSIEGVLIVEPELKPDRRGYFMETYQEEKFRNLGLPTKFDKIIILCLIKINPWFALSGALATRKTGPCIAWCSYGRSRRYSERLTNLWAVGIL